MEIRLVASKLNMLLLWPVRCQKEDTEEEKVCGTSVLNNRTYLQNKGVCTASRSIRPKTVRFNCWKEVGIYRMSHRPDECGTRPFLGGSDAGP